ncbi:hypothetical protein [Streptomyces sp. CBMA156]|uniref:hypothetical protein n=1 Tax=Streptomyces sp. CBMA156 TaxID=1930280 RepID=UPI001661F122|nr:hypothetical protein [Streptomyces sp. CBMA156]MBD0673200.1 hypothetical protein [Streptomyces sp. CBMA156]
MDGDELFEFGGMVGPVDCRLDGEPEGWAGPPAGDGVTGRALPGPDGVARVRPCSGEEDDVVRAFGGRRNREACPYC